MWKPLPLAFVLLVNASAFSQEAAPRRVSLTWENDLFAGSDRHYTNGVELSVYGDMPSGFFRSRSRAEWGVALGQEIYTPEDVRSSELVRDDRPYAGWSYLRLSLRRFNIEGATRDVFALELGAVGPTAGAEATHGFVHGITGSTRPKGWNNQLRDEFGFALSYERHLRLSQGSFFGVGYDVTPYVKASLGNVSTRAGLGAEARIGLGILPEQDEGLRFFVTAKVEANLVGYDVFLDGNLLRSGSHRVEKELFVADIAVGFTFAISDRLSVSYTHTYRTPEFEGQDRANQFGSLSVSVSW